MSKADQDITVLEIDHEDDVEHQAGEKRPHEQSDHESTTTEPSFKRLRLRPWRIKKLMNTNCLKKWRYMPINTWNVLC